MCADELKESREMPLKSCLHCPFPFKCPLIQAGPGFRGSHGNPDSELFLKEILEYWPWVKERQIFLQLFFSSQLGLFEILTTQWAHGGVCPLGRLATDEAEKWRLSVWIREWPVCSHWHATLLPLQLPALTTSHTANVTRGMFARPLAQTYTCCMYMNTYKRHCKLIHSQSINQPILIFFILLFYVCYDAIFLMNSRLMKKDFLSIIHSLKFLQNSLYSLIYLITMQLETSPSLHYNVHVHQINTCASVAILQASCATWLDCSHYIQHHCLYCKQRNTG